jgi:protein-tyrosine phosphatase
VNATRLLFVCTANVCRSPMAEGLAADLAAARGLDLEVASCGVLEGGAPADPTAARTIARWGVDLARHESHQMAADVLRGADLVLTMERAHLAEVAAVDVDAVDRSFPLREFVGLGIARGPEEAPRAWIARAAEARDGGRIFSIDRSDDVADPIGRSRWAYRRCAIQLAELVSAVLDLAQGRTGPSHG